MMFFLRRMDEIPQPNDNRKPAGIFQNRNKVEFTVEFQ